MLRVAEHGDVEAYGKLVGRWGGKIRRLCVRMMAGDEGWGEDLAQETFARIFEKRREWRPVGRFSTWMWRVAINLCTSELRKRARRGDRVLEPGEGESTEITPLEEVVANEEAELVRRAVAGLPENYRAVLVLRHYEGLKRREIAEVLEIAEGTVSSRMAVALEKLSGELAPVLGRSGVVAEGGGAEARLFCEPERETL